MERFRHYQGSIRQGRSMPRLIHLKKKEESMLVCLLTKYLRGGGQGGKNRTNSLKTYN